MDARGPAGRADTSPIAFAAAVSLAAVCMMPFLVWGNIYPTPVLRFWAFGAIVLLPIAAGVGAMPDNRLLRAQERLRAAILRPSPVVFAVIVGGVAMLLAVYFAVAVFQRAPSTSDEIAQLWHAKILLHGRLALPPDPNPEFFAIDNVIDRGGWYSHFPIGGPLALVPGLSLGVPWLVNPVCAGLAVVCFLHFARVAFGELEGRVAAALLALTPGVLFMSGTFLNHLPTLTLAMLALAALAEWDRAATRHRGAAWAAVVGAAIGGMATIRPLDAVVLAGVVGAFQLAVIIRRRRHPAELLAQFVAGAVVVAPLLYANWATNGSPLRFGYDVMWGAGHRVGFHTDPHGEPHTVARAITYLLRYTIEANYSIMVWPAPALGVAFVALAALRRVSRWDALLIGFLAAQLAAYAAYWGLGEFLGPRFLFTAYPALVALLARAPCLVAQQGNPRTGRAVGAFVILCTVAAWVAPPAAGAVTASVRAIRESRRAMRVNVARDARAAGLHHALVFIREQFSARLLHRVWGVGVSRQDAVAIITSRDACSLLTAVEALESDSLHTLGDPAAYIMRTARAFERGPLQVGTPDPNIRISSPETVTPSCRAEFDPPDWTPTFFGAALPAEPFNAAGALDGDVIYAMDLGPRNEVLRARFGDRAWYRMVLDPRGGGTLRASFASY